MRLKKINKRHLQWLGIFLFFAAAPQYMFRIAGKILRPVVDVAADVVATVETLGENDSD